MADNNLQGNNRRDPLMIPIGQLLGNMRAKREVYLALGIECKAYMDDEPNMTCFFMKQYFSGEKSFLRQHEVNSVFCPQYSGLTIDSVLEEFGGNVTLQRYLPDDPKEVRRFHKKFIVNLAATIIGEPFMAWMKSKIEERNKEVTVKRNMMVAVDPQIYECIKNSTQVSLTNGIGCNMLKVSSKKRRTAAEMRDEKAKSQSMGADVKQKMKEYDAMVAKIKELEQLATNNQEAANILTNMINTNQANIDEAGNVTINEPSTPTAMDGNFA